jgi:hypothetical protein
MTDRRQRQPASDETPHAVPENAAVLATPRQRAMPKPADSEPKNRQRRLVHGHSVVAEVSTYNRPQPLALLGDGFVHSSPKLGFHLVQLRLQPFPYRLPQHREPSIAPLLYADMRKAEKVERLRLPFSTPLPLVDRIGTELEKSRFEPVHRRDLPAKPGAAIPQTCRPNRLSSSFPPNLVTSKALRSRSWITHVRFNARLSRAAPSAPPRCCARSSPDTGMRIGDVEPALARLQYPVLQSPFFHPR